MGWEVTGEEWLLAAFQAGWGATGSHRLIGTGHYRVYHCDFNSRSLRFLLCKMGMILTTLKCIQYHVKY